MHRHDFTRHTPVSSFSHQELGYWMQHVHALPPLRFEKVRIVRQLLREARYETEHHLDETIRRLSEDVAITSQS